MFSYLKARFAAFISSELSVCRARYNNKCTECRLLSEKIQRMESDTHEVDARLELLKSEISRLNVEIEQKDIAIESRDNQIRLTDEIVAQQYQIIKRDYELRRLEHLDASVRVRLASSVNDQGSFKEETSNGVHESDINYRPGR